MDDSAELEVVVVPMEPDLVRPVPRRRRRRDELDDVVDELLGADEDPAPGLADAALVGAAAGLVGWGMLAGGRVWALGIGMALLLLGGATPACWAWRRAAAGMLRRKQARALAQGLPLAVAGQEVRSLLGAHRRVLSSSAAGTVRSGAHAALVEVAAALGGEPAHDAATRQFVRERADAVRALADALEALPAVRRSQMLEARREVAGVGGFDSLDLLDGLVREVRSGGDRA